MKTVLKFLRLDPAERRLFLLSFVLLGATGIGLLLMPFGNLARMLRAIPAANKCRQGPAGITPDEIVKCVKRSGRYLPFAKCLAQALVVYTLFIRQGFPASLYLGVAKTNDHRLEAHAWVESGGWIVIGGDRNMGRFARLPPLSPLLTKPAMGETDKSR